MEAVADLLPGAEKHEAPERMGADDGDEQHSAPPDPTGQDLGWWLTHPDAAQVKKAVLDLWKSTDRYEEKRSAKERRNELQRAGVRGVQVIEDEDEDRFSIRVPFGSSDAPKAPNKADQLLRRIVATLTVDPPSPDVSPNADSDDERQAAELAQRVLHVEGSPAKRDDVSMLRRVLDLSGTYATIYVHTGWDTRAAGLVPLEVQAHPKATTADNALVDPTPDPTTGQPMPADPATLTTRYVTIDGSLTDTPSDAQLVWSGDVVEHILYPSQVRAVPAIAARIEEADGALVGRVTTLSQLVAECYDGERPSEEVVKKLCDWRPDGWRQWVPRALRPLLDEKTPTRPDGTIADHALVCTITLYFTSCTDAPLGARIVVSGATEPHTREPRKVTIGEGASSRVEILPLPLAQMTWSEDTSSGDPKGIAGIEQLAPMEEIRAQALRYILDYMWRFGSPQTFVPMDSTMQMADMQRRDGTPIRIIPGSQPYFEQAPPMAPVLPQVYEGMGKEEDTASGLEEAAQGVSSSSVKSGVHAQQIIEQALVALAGIQQNASRFITRVWRNRLIYLRAYLDVPRQLQALGDGGDVQVQSFAGIDLVGAGDITVAKGTNTMMPKSAKTALAREELQLAMTTGDQMGALRYQRSITGNTGPLLGLQDDPHRARIARQLLAWRDGAKGQHPEPPPPMPGMDPMTGAPMMQPAPDPVQAEAAKVFAPNPTDELPMVAPIRFAELSDALAERGFLTADPRYQQALVQEYERMRQAAGIQTRMEQMQMQAQQQAQAQQQQMQQETHKQQSKAQAKPAPTQGAPDGVAAERTAMQSAAQSVMGQPAPNS